MNGWIGVDLDGTLAHYDGWKGDKHIGEPIPTMLKRVLAWLADGQEVRIVTARAGDAEALPIIQAWLIQHGIEQCGITTSKDYSMIELWDDRAVQVVPNTGERVDGKP